MHGSTHHLQNPKRRLRQTQAVPASSRPHSRWSAAAISSPQKRVITDGEMHFGVCPTSVIAQRAPHASSALPQDMSAQQTKSVITLDLRFNRLWQHWKVVNEIAFFICVSVSANKSNPEHASCAASPVYGWLNQTAPAVIPSSGRDNHVFKFCLDIFTSPPRLHTAYSHDGKKKWELDNGDCIVSACHKVGTVVSPQEVGPIWYMSLNCGSSSPCNTILLLLLLLLLLPLYFLRSTAVKMEKKSPQKGPNLTTDQIRLHL